MNALLYSHTGTAALRSSTCSLHTEVYTYHAQQRHTRTYEHDAFFASLNSIVPHFYRTSNVHSNLLLLRAHLRVSRYLERRTNSFHRRNEQ